MICSCEYWTWNQADLYLVLMQVKMLTVMFSHTYKTKCNMVHIKNQCKYTRTLYPYSYALSASPCLNFQHDPLTIFPIKYMGINEHGGHYN